MCSSTPSERSDRGLRDHGAAFDRFGEVGVCAGAHPDPGPVAIGGHPSRRRSGKSQRRDDRLNLAKRQGRSQRGREQGACRRGFAPPVYRLTRRSTSSSLSGRVRSRQKRVPPGATNRAISRERDGRFGDVVDDGIGDHGLDSVPSGSVNPLASTLSVSDARLETRLRGRSWRRVRASAPKGRPPRAGSAGPSRASSIGIRAVPVPTSRMVPPRQGPCARQEVLGEPRVHLGVVHRVIFERFVGRVHRLGFKRAGDHGARGLVENGFEPRADDGEGARAQPEDRPDHEPERAATARPRWPCSVSVLNRRRSTSVPIR